MERKIIYGKKENESGSACRFLQSMSYPDKKKNNSSQS